MQFSINDTLFSTPTDCLILGVCEQQLLPSTINADEISQGYLNQLIKNGELASSIGSSLLLHNVPQLENTRVLLVNCGKYSELDEGKYKQIIQHVYTQLSQTQVKTVFNCLTELPIKGRNLYWNLRFAIETLAQQDYQFNQFKTLNPQKSIALQEMHFLVNNDHKPIAEQAIQHAQAIAHGVKQARDLANLPPNVCNPAYLVEQAKALAEQSDLIQSTIIDEKQMAELGMNAYLAVSRGSNNPAFLSILEYRNHPDSNAKPIVLVGKGLTFDAGGISLKPADSMDEMKYDMCGAASVFGVMNAIAQLRLPLNVIGVLAGCENLPDGNSYRPGDILTTMSGLTVEILNTDAEGRLVLCDTLTYIERFEPQLVIDVATLTGACVVALGQHNSGLISTDDNLALQLEQAAQQSTDKAWRLPLSEEYQQQLKSNFADLANIGGRWGGAITAGAFLSNFSKNYPWAHLDIAGTAWLQGANKGATGRPVSLLVQFLLNQVAAQ